MYATAEVRTSGKSLPNALGKQVVVVGSVTQVGGSSIQLKTHDDVTVIAKLASNTTMPPAENSVVEVKGMVLPDQSIQATGYITYDEDFDMKMYGEAMQLVDEFPIFQTN